jgi:C4-dicarboxylate-specific signal transduction histidine kinase
MINYVALGFMVAIIVMLAIAIIWHWASSKLERWGYNLIRETNRQLRDADYKLDSILNRQQYLERAISTQTDTLRDLRSHITSHKIAS